MKTKTAIVAALALATSSIVVTAAQRTFPPTYYEGNMEVNLASIGQSNMVTPDFVVSVTPTNYGATVVLYNFMIDTESLGDVTIANAQMGDGQNGNLVIEGATDDVATNNGTATVECEGQLTDDGYLNLDLLVIMGNDSISAAFSGSYLSIDDVDNIDYRGELKMDMTTMSMADEDLTNQSVSITPLSKGLCIVTIKNVMLGSENAGNIVVENVKVTTNPDGSKTFAGSKQNQSLEGGQIFADVTLSGTETEDGHLTLNVTLKWDDVTIPLTFDGYRATTSIRTITNSNPGASPVYYKLDGTMASSRNLMPGIYIRRQGSVAEKILIK